MSEALENISSQVRERLSFIDFHLFLLGKVGRKDLSDRFGISAPAATRDFRSYHKIAPNNLIYSPSERTYFRSDKFTLLTSPSIEKCLSTLSYGFGDFETVEQCLGIVETTKLGIPDIDTLAAVTRAINNKQAIEIKYFSTTSGEGLRTIVPHTLVDTGMRWHCRAYCRKVKGFRDFVINRIMYVSCDPGSKAREDELKKSDFDWNTTVPLELKPHPSLGNKSKAIELDYNMVEGSVIVRTKLAKASYLLAGWNVDITEDFSEKGKQFQLFLGNRKEILSRFGERLFVASDKKYSKK